MASPVSRPLFHDTALMIASFKEVMVTEKGPIAPRLTDEQIAGIFAYGQSHYEEMSRTENGMYHLRPSKTGLSRSITWIKDEAGIDFLVHCNKLNKETGGDQPLSEFSTGAEKQLSYAFSCYHRLILLSGAVKCFPSDRMDNPYSSLKVAYALKLQHESAGPGVANITNAIAYRMKPKSRVIPPKFSTSPSYKFRFFMEKADCDLFDANPLSAPFSKKIKLIQSLLRAVKDLHDRDTVHCDLKLENCLIYGDLQYLELTDFGAAIRKQDLGKGIYQTFSLPYKDPESIISLPSSFEALKALDIWQSALIISYILDDHAVLGLFPTSIPNPTKEQLTAKFSTLTPGWYRENYSALLKEIYRSHPEIIGPLIALMDRMLHPLGRERPRIDECIDVIETLMLKTEFTESTPKT